MGNLLPVAALVVLLGQTAHPKIAVPALEATDGSRALADSLTLLIPTEVRKRDRAAQVISSAEVQNMLGLERQKALLGCDSSSCLTELAGALGVDELLAGKIGKIGQTFVLELRRMDVNNARVIATTTRTLRGEEDGLIEAVQSAVAELYPLQGAANPPLALERPPEAGHGPTLGGSRLLPALIGGAGLAVAAAGTVGIVASLKTGSRFAAQQPGGVNAEAPTVTRAELGQAQLINQLSWGAAVVGAAGVAFGLRGLLAPGSTPAVGVAPRGAGAELTLAGAL